MRLLYRYITQIIPPIEDGCYGYLYNWYTVDDSREITSSVDWSVPTNSQIESLRSYLDPGGASTSNIAGGKMKEVGLNRWDSPNTGATNLSGFTGIGSGTRTDWDGNFYSLNISGGFWTQTESIDDVTFAHAGNLSKNSETFFAGTSYGKKKAGFVIRLVKDAIGIPDGTQTTYTGNDGKIYPAIAINGKYWLQQNLEETQYRNGDPIYNVEDATTWSNLTEGALCLYDNNESYACKTPLPTKPCYGYLYNWYAVDDSREITSSVDWSVPTTTQIDDFILYIGAADGGGKLKSTSSLFWNAPNTGATNEYGFNAKGEGYRNNASGAFLGIKDNSRFWSSTEVTSLFGRVAQIGTTSALINTIAWQKEMGSSIRLVKDATGLADGVTTTYTGNDGKTYNAIVINELYWTTENLEETEYRNGDPIPNITDNISWSNLTTGALCLYDNNDNYACKGNPPAGEYIYENTPRTGAVGTSTAWNYVAQNISNVSGDISSVSCYFRNINNPEYNITAYIYDGHISDNASTPGGTTNLVSTSTNTVNSSEISSDFTLINFYFNNATVGNNYSIVLAFTDRTLWNGTNKPDIGTGSIVVDGLNTSVYFTSNYDIRSSQTAAVKIIYSNVSS